MHPMRLYESDIQKSTDIFRGASLYSSGHLRIHVRIPMDRHHLRSPALCNKPDAGTIKLKKLANGKAEEEFSTSLKLKQCNPITS